MAGEDEPNGGRWTSEVMARATTMEESGATAEARQRAYEMFVEANARLAVRLSVVAEAEGGVPLEVFEVLSALGGAPDQRLRHCELAERVVLSRSGLTRRIDRMEGDGLVRRESCEGDRRGSYAVLTEKGRKAREAAWPSLREGIRAHFGDRMTEGEARQLSALMKRVIESLTKKAE